MKTKSTIPPLVDNGKWCLTDEDKANSLNNFFQKVFTEDDGCSLNIQYKETNLMENFIIQDSDIQEAVGSMKDKITRTPECIPPYFIKRTLPALMPILLFLFNVSLEHGVVPSQWKKALVVPVFKKGDQTQPSNYRPISLTSTFSRIMESILHKKVLDHLLSNNLISPNQYGFVPGRSSCSQILNCLHEWIKAYCRHQTTHVIYTDISKAFDTVSHTKLIQVIKSYKLNNSVITWIQNFLNNRKQQVVINKDFSNIGNVNSGIPQGSILGPLLFILYINDVDSCGRSLDGYGGFRLFADDTKVFCTDVQKLQSSLDNVSDWLKSRQLNLSINKCFSLHVGRPSSNKPNFKISNQPILPSSTAKDLGIYISDSLKWTTHVNQIYKNARNSSYHIIKFSKTKNIWILRKLFITYVRPKIEYSTPVWSPSLKKDIDKIERIQKDFTRFACRRCSISYTNYSDRLYKLNLQSLEQRRINNDLVFLYKTINNLTGLNFDDYFINRIQTYNLRGDKNQIIPKFNNNTPHWHNSFFNRVCKFWNKLGDKIKMARSVEIFKTNLLKADLSEHLLYY